MKIRSVVMGALWIAGALAAGAAQAGTLEQVKEKGVLVVGVKYRVPPFGFVDQTKGEVVGFDVDYAKAIAAKLGVKAQLRAVDHTNRISELVSGNVDLVAANLAKDPDVDTVIDLSDAYVIVGQGFVAGKGKVASLKDLNGKKVGVRAKSVTAEALKAAVPGAKAVPFNDFQKGLEALKSGSIDAVTGDLSLAPALLAMLPKDQFEIPDIRIAEYPYVMGVRHGDKGLLDVVNQTIAELNQSGQAQKLYDKWFKPAPPAGPALADTAGGAIVRKASVRPRFVAVPLRGYFTKGATVTVFDLSGNPVCKAKVASVLGDSLYIDVDDARYEYVQPGFAVGQNIDAATAKGLIAKHQDTLQSVRADAQKEEARLAAEREKEGLDKQQRNIAADQARAASRLRVEEERAINNDDSYDVNYSWSRD